jgi:D-alanyl-D-alanine carboxypeptidase (penicillin-binding protein 5/6)
MENPTLARISGTRVFENWTSNNQMLPFAPLGYPYMLGGMTGFTNAAGHIFAGAARQEHLQLVTVVLGGTSDGRWLDTRRLMDYGFSNFRFREVARADELVATVAIQNPQMGETGYLDVVSTQGFTALLHRNTYAAIVRDITFDPLLYVEEATLLAPIEQHMHVGEVTYTANGVTIFSAPIAAAETVYAQNFDSDMDYFLARIFGNIFSRQAVPYWFGVFGTIFGMVGIFLTLTADRRAEKKRSIRYTRY